MARRNFSEILRDASIDIRREYDRLYGIFYLQKNIDQSGFSYSLRDYCSMNFMNLPFRGTCISLDDFEDYHKIYYERKPSELDVDYLISFCEYSYNLVIHLQPPTPSVFGMSSPHQLYLQQVLKVIDLLCYIQSSDNGIVIFVPKSSAVISAAEIVKPSLSYKIIEYNHHALQGNIEGKKAILLLLAEELEPKKKELKKISQSLENDLFTLFNNLNLRHNNCDSDSQYYKPIVADMPKNELEQWYDETYQLCLLSFLELDNIERTEKIRVLKERLKSGD